MATLTTYKLIRAHPDMRLMLENFLEKIYIFHLIEATRIGHFKSKNGFGAKFT